MNINEPKSATGHNVAKFNTSDMNVPICDQGDDVLHLGYMWTSTENDKRNFTIK